MSASIRAAVCYVLLLIFPILFATKDPTLNDVLTALEKMVSFYKLTHRDMNLDGIYGLRVLEGQILVLLMEYEKGRHQHLPLSVVARLHMLHQRARNVSERSLPFLAAQDKAYYTKLRPLVEKPFMVAHEYRRVDLTLRWIQTEKQRREVPFDEEFSDRCMAELMGTERTDGRTCLMSPQCLNAMFVRGTGEYQITHQLLYMMMAEQEGCVNGLNQWLRSNGWPGGMQQLYLEFCTNNLLEIQQQMSALDGGVIPIYQDLFMEQQFVCPVLGFMEFLHADWLRQILDWQKANGCFGRMPVTDFAKSYKDMHHLDYQYEDDVVSKRPPLVDKHKKPQQQNLQYQVNVNTMKKSSNNYIDKDSAVIQQSNKLQIVSGSMKNNTFLNSYPNGKTGSLQTNNQQRQIVKRSFSESLPAQIHSKKSSGKTKGDSRGRKQKQSSINGQLFQQKISTQYHDTLNAGPDQQDYLSSNKITAKDDAPAKETIVEAYANDDSPAINNMKNGGWPVFKGESNGQRGEDNFLIRRLQRHKVANKGLKHHLGASRRLLFERDLADNCLSHKTAVAAGALSQYLRLLINPGTPEFRSQYRIDGTNLILNPQALLQASNSKKTPGGIVLHGGQKKKKQSGVVKMSKGKNANGGGAAQRNNNNDNINNGGKAKRGKGAKVVLRGAGVGVGGGGGAVRSVRPQQQQSVVVPRPHPDDIIHSEANDNANAAGAGGDQEDNHPQDYYDPDDDQEEEDEEDEDENEDGDNDTENYHNAAGEMLDPPGRPVNLLHHRARPPPVADLPKLSLHHARFRHGAHAGEEFQRGRLGGDTNKGDEEYEQYVDDEEEQLDNNRVQKLDLLSPPQREGNAGGPPPRRVVINVPAGETAREANHDEDTYSYYDRDDADAPPPAPIQQRRVKLAAPHVYHRSPRRTQRPPAQPHKQQGPQPGDEQHKPVPHPGVVNPPGRIYMVLFSVMLILLVFMYRFVKKRRIVIRYPRNTFR